MPARQWSPIDSLKAYALIVARKMSFIAIAWVPMYFITQVFRAEPSQSAGGINILTLFAPMVGAASGLVAGWYMATDSVEDSNMQGLPLWVILVAASIAPILAVEGIFYLILRWPVNFGGFMVVMPAMLLALAAAVWHAATQE